MRLAGVLGALALGAGGFTVTTLPRPAFPGPSTWTPYAPHRLVLVSSRFEAPECSKSEISSADRFHGLQDQVTFPTGNRQFSIYGKDGATGRYLVASDKSGHRLYAFDFENYAWPPRIKPGDREFVYEQPVWAQEANGVLYVETAHSTYARSSYNRTAYITAIALKTRRALWRTPALVANAEMFLVTKHYLVTGYGFTEEPDYLYLLDRATGKVVDQLRLPTAPERIFQQGKLIRVRTYDHVVLVRLRGA